MTAADTAGKRWLFCYGRSTDAARMEEESGGWYRRAPAVLPDYVYTFSGEHWEFGGGTSTLVEARGGVVLGAAYLVDQDQLDRIQAGTPAYGLYDCRIEVDGELQPAILLRRQETAPVCPPSDKYREWVRHGLSQLHDPGAVDLYLATAVRRAERTWPVRRRSPDTGDFRREYGVDFWRLFTRDETPSQSFGAGWSRIRRGEETTPQAHDEEEAFFVLAGSGTMSADGREFAIKAGDHVYIEPFVSHAISNQADEPLDVLGVWWGGAPPVVDEED